MEVLLVAIVVLLNDDDDGDEDGREEIHHNEVRNDDAHEPQIQMHRVSLFSPHPLTTRDFVMSR